MKILIAGAGVVGMNLSSKLSSQGHDVILIDQSNEPLRTAEEQFDLKTMVGDASNVELLKKINIHEMDLVIAVTSHDSTNVLICHLASRMGARRRIARIRQSECFSDPMVLLPHDMGIDLVMYPEQQAARAIINLIFHPYATEVVSFFNNQMELIGLNLAGNKVLPGKKVMELQSLSSQPFRLVGILRQEEALIPRDPQEILRPDDKILAVSVAEKTEVLAKDLGFQRSNPRKVFLFGGSSIGYNVAKSLEETSVQIRLLEPSPSRTRELAVNLRKALVLQGDGSDTALLEGEGIDEADVFVAASENEEANLLSCVLAKKIGAKKAFALITKQDYFDIVSSLGIDGAVSQRMMTINRILQFVRRGEVISVSELREGKIEAIEFRVTNNSPLVGRALGSNEFRDIFPPTAMIGGVQNILGEASVPDENTILSEGDRAMVYCQAHSVLELEKLFV